MLGPTRSVRHPAPTEFGLAGRLSAKYEADPHDHAEVEVEHGDTAVLTVSPRGAISSFHGVMCFNGRCGKK